MLRLKADSQFHVPDLPECEPCFLRQTAIRTDCMSVRLTEKTGKFFRKEKIRVSSVSVPCPVVLRRKSETLLEHCAEVIAVAETAEMCNLREVERIMQPDKNFRLFHSSFAKKLPETLSEVALKQFPQIVGIDVQRVGKLRE